MSPVNPGFANHAAPAAASFGGSRRVLARAIGALRATVSPGTVRSAVAAAVLCGSIAGAGAVEFMRNTSEVMTLQQRREAITDLLPHLRRLHDALRDMETGQRGFLLTGADTYLEPFERGRHEFDLHLQALDAAMARGQVARAPLQELHRLALVKRDEMERTIALRRERGLAAALDVVHGGQGKAAMDAFRQLHATVEHDLRSERAALGGETEDALADARLSLGWAGGTTAGTLLLSLGALARRHRRLTDRHAELMHDATHEPLTGLPNRRYLMDTLERQMASARRHGLPVSVLFLDLDGFKGVNDRLGHDVGDAVLREAAARLRAQLRTSDLLARLGGDEFVVVVTDPHDDDALRALAAKLLAAFEAPMAAGLRTGDVGTSIGIATAGADDDAASVLRAADAAMYEAKRAGRRTWRLAGEIDASRRPH